MKTITTKTAKNGAQLWYVDGKRTSRDKAVETGIANGRENLKNLVAGLTADPAVFNDIGIIAEMESELGDRYTEYFYFKTAEGAVTAAKKIVALGKQVQRVVIDNGRPYPSNIRYADTVRGKLIFLNDFKRFDATADSDIDGFDESAFDLLPTVDELNDTRSDIEKMFDEFDAEDTDRDARFNHGERHAEKLTAKLRKFDPTVEVTYDIDEDDEDTFFMTYDGIYGGIYGTLDAAEDAFHRLKKNQAEIAADPWFNRNDKSRENAPVNETAHEVTVWDDGVVTEKPRNPETVTVKTAEDAWDILDAKFPGKFVISATHTCWDGIKTVTFRNDADKLRLDVLSDVTHGGAIFQMTVARFDNELEPVFKIEVIDDEPSREKSDVEIAEELTDRLLKVTPWNAGYMNLTLQNGKATIANPRTAIIEPDWHGNARFAFVTPWNEIYARYDTVAQVNSVINRIKACVDGKIDSFTYPTVSELKNEPAPVTGGDEHERT